MKAVAIFALLLFFLAGPPASAAYFDRMELKDLFGEMKEAEKELGSSTEKMAAGLLQSKERLEPLLDEYVRLGPEERKKARLLRSRLEKGASEILGSMLPLMDETITSGDRAGMRLTELEERLTGVEEHARVKAADSRNALRRHMETLKKEGETLQGLSRGIRNGSREAPLRELRQHMRLYNQAFVRARMRKIELDNYRQVSRGIGSAREGIGKARDDLARAVEEMASGREMIVSTARSKKPLSELQLALAQVFSGGSSSIGSITRSTRVIREMTGFVEKLLGVLAHDEGIDPQGLAPMGESGRGRTLEEEMDSFKNWSFQKLEKELGEE